MSEPSLRIVFAGTPDFAAQHLQALLASRHHVVAVYTQPDRPAGRGRKLTPSPVKQLALHHQIDVQQPLQLRDPNSLASLRAYNADIMVVVAYGLLLPQAVLDMPAYGCLNVHGSLLPRWRGAAPIQRALLAGDKETGICIMQMVVGLDTGPVITARRLPITVSDTSASLYEKLSKLGQSALLSTLNNINQCQVIPQDNKLATYAHKLTKSEGSLDWQQSAIQLCRQVRGYNPWPVAYTDFGQQRLRIWHSQVTDKPPNTSTAAPGSLLAYSKQGITVACGDGFLLITQLQWPGAKPIQGAQIKNLQQKLPLGSIFQNKQEREHVREHEGD